MFILEQQWGQWWVTVGTTKLKAIDEVNGTNAAGEHVMYPAGTEGVLVAMEVDPGHLQSDPWCWVLTPEGGNLEGGGCGFEICP